MYTYDDLLKEDNNHTDDDFITEHFEKFSILLPVLLWQNKRTALIRKLQDEYILSASQNLPEEFIRTFSDKVNWYEISLHQHLSEDFIFVFRDRIDWKALNHNPNLSDEFRQKYQSRLDDRLWDSH